MINGASRKGRHFWNKGNLGGPAVDGLNGYANQFDGKLEFLRGYVAAAGGSKRSISWTSLSDFKYFSANPRVSRFFSTEPPNKKGKTPVFIFL